MKIFEDTSFVNPGVYEHSPSPKFDLFKSLQERNKVSVDEEKAIKLREMLAKENARQQKLNEIKSQ